MPDIKQKLIELICSTEYGNSSLIGNNFQKGFIEKIADHIISSGFIEELQNEAYDLGVDSALHNHFGLSWEDADGLRKEVARLQNATKWIPVTERLPDDDIPSAAYLCWWHGHIQICKYWRTRKVFEFKGREVAAEYWMPLPEKPKEE